MRNSISACDSAMVAGFNRRMPKTARPVVWEDLRAQSRRPDPINIVPSLESFAAGIMFSLKYPCVSACILFQHRYPCFHLPLNVRGTGFTPMYADSASCVIRVYLRASCFKHSSNIVLCLLVCNGYPALCPSARFRLAKHPRALGQGAVREAQIPSWQKISFPARLVLKHVCP